MKKVPPPKTRLDCEAFFHSTRALKLAAKQGSSKVTTWETAEGGALMRSKTDLENVFPHSLSVNKASHNGLQ